MCISIKYFNLLGIISRLFNEWLVGGSTLVMRVISGITIHLMFKDFEYLS